MATINNFEDLEIWQNARELCKKINQYCLHNPKFLNHDKNQIDRASASIMDNIAEGFEREGNKEFVNFLTMSKGSAGEVERLFRGWLLYWWAYFVDEVQVCLFSFVVNE